MQLLQYGIKDGALIHIDDVLNGLACGCFCPSCGGRLEAHQGQKKRHHFKHHKVIDCNHGSETALHLLAKNIVAQTKIVYVPNAPKSIYDVSPKGKCYRFQNAYIEKQLTPQIRCDVLLESDSIFLNVEIKVTHEVDTEKKRRLLNEEIRTIEIDLSNCIDDFNEQKIQTIIQNGTRTTLLYSPKAKDIFTKWLHGEWKEVHRDRGGSEYVTNCPISGKTAYFSAWKAYREHGRMECHECACFRDYDGGKLFLCY